MTIDTIDIEFDKQTLTLTNQRAMYWSAQRMIVLSDIHIGKTAHFRQYGIPIPDQILLSDLKRLAELIAYFKPQTVLIVGDLFHAGSNINFIVFREWLSQYDCLNWILIKGNHDRFKDSFYEEMNIMVEKKMELDGITLLHEPDFECDSEYQISGHLHPGVLLKFLGRQSIKLPCFLETERQIVLPAFSLFTGLFCNYKLPLKNLYAFTEQEIWKEKASSKY